MKKLQIDNLLQELKSIADGQRDAIKCNDMDQLFELQERRREIIAKIQNIDISPNSNSTTAKEIITEIINIDDEIKKLIKTNMNIIVSSLSNINNIRDFLKSKDYKHKLCLNI